MPRKTRKEKILASHHKQIHLMADKPLSQELPVQKEIQTKVVQSSENQNNFFFFNDLKKSLILTAIVITLEITLYFARLIK
jgi:hypothetical protein